MIDFVKRRIRNLTTSEIFEVYDNYQDLKEDKRSDVNLLKALMNEFDYLLTNSQIAEMVFEEYVRRDFENIKN